jgi:hypothetical protein
MLIDLIRAESIIPGPECAVRTVLRKLSETDAADLETVFASEDFSTAAIYRALKKAGHEIHVSTLGRHRRQECTCFRAA